MDTVRKMHVNSNSSVSSHNPGVIGNRPGQIGNMNGNQRPQTQMYMNPKSMVPNTTSVEDVDDLTRTFRGMNLQTPAFSQSAQASPHPSQPSSSSGGVALGPHIPYIYNGQIVFSQAPYYPQQGGQGVTSSGMYAAPGGNMANHSAFNTYNPPHFAEHSPPSWQSSRMTSSQMPSLVTPRRSSGGSSNEQDVPGTPFTQYTGFGGGVPVFDHSPNSLYAWSTPSPSQTRFGISKPQQQTQIPLHLQILCQQEPAIPKAVPAPFSPTKPLDRRLENPNGITNVYVRGLQPNTTDEMLYNLAKRFGDIESSKAIIDLNTGLCKGFGFVKYYNFKDAEDCIRGFHFCGYETSFARESFYSQLKKLGDQEATNLYISNLPIEFNEHDLGAIFEGIDVCSKRILRNPDGSGRGVGFARFANHDVCEQVILEFSNRPVAKANGEKYNIQIRYADTPEQKALKQQTTAARQYRSAEYESQTSQDPGAFVARFHGVNGLEQYVPGINNIVQPNEYLTSNGMNGRVPSLSTHLSPSHASVNPNVNFNMPANGHVSISQGSECADNDEDTIHAPIQAPTSSDNASAHAESDCNI